MSPTTRLPYNSAKDGGCCEICRAPATHVLVKLRNDIALDLLRIVCTAHRPDDPADLDRHHPDDLAGTDSGDLDLADQDLAGGGAPTSAVRDFGPQGAV